MPATKITIDATPEAIESALAAVTALSAAEQEYEARLAKAQVAYDKAKAEADEFIGKARAAARSAGLSFASVSVGRRGGSSSSAKIADVAVLAHLKKGKANGQTVGEIASAGAWSDTKPVSDALKALVADGRAARSGERRATRYYVP